MNFRQTLDIKLELPQKLNNAKNTLEISSVFFAFRWLVFIFYSKLFQLNQNLLADSSKQLKYLQSLLGNE